MSLWRKILRTNFTDVVALAQFLELDPSYFITHPKFVLNVPRRLAEKMEKGSVQDPILRQFVPLLAENAQHERFQQDPVQDRSFLKVEKLIQKYAGRALVVSTSACAMHCRYCFRQNFPYETTRKGFDAELETIRINPSLSEVILSGGDPLSLSDESLQDLLQQLDGIDHLKRIRFHSRFPIGIPERIDASLLRILAQVRKQIWFVVHVNHPRELDQDVFLALKSVQKMGIPVLNQAVLLKGVNDQLEILKELSETLADHGILPYYLHQLDRVQGAAHFEVPAEIGLKLVRDLSHSVSGYALPRYVQEIAGSPSKTPLA